MVTNVEDYYGFANKNYFPDCKIELQSLDDQTLLHLIKKYTYTVDNILQCLRMILLYYI